MIKYHIHLHFRLQQNKRTKIRHDFMSMNSNHSVRQIWTLELLSLVHFTRFDYHICHTKFKTTFVSSWLHFIFSLLCLFSLFIHLFSKCRAKLLLWFLLMNMLTSSNTMHYNTHYKSSRPYFVVLKVNHCLMHLITQ